MPASAALRGYDAWRTTQPDAPDLPLPGDPAYPSCGACGAFLRRDADRIDGKTTEALCDGRAGDYVAECGRAASHEPHFFVAHAWGEQHRTCARCGKDNIEVSV